MAAVVTEFLQGNYRFIPGGLPFSGGVAATVGHEIKRFRFRSPVPLIDGFARIEGVIRGAGRPLTAFCACELRSPGQFTEAGFRAFNESYAAMLSKWGIFDGKVNPVARSNVCPEIDPPAEPGFHAFAFTVPTATEGAPSFIISGRAEAREGEASYRERIVRFGEIGADALREKVRYVIDGVTDRLVRFGLTWGDATATQFYTIRDIHPFAVDEIVRRGVATMGMTWHFARPPVRDLEFEVDCRGIRVEEFI